MSKAKTATALLSAGMLACAGAAAVVPAIAVADQAPVAAEQQAEGQAVAAKAAVAGTFAWNQDGISTIDYIKAVFSRAASICANMPTYDLSLQDGVIYVTGPNGTFGATVEEIAADEGAALYILACACASNVAGGGAVANAEVEGVALAGLAAAAGAL